jgi:outer membrane protein assembly factor BamB
VYAFDATTGAPVWTSLDTTASISSSPAVAGGKIFVTNDFEELYYLDQGSGQGVNLLATSCGGSGHSSPAISNGTVFCGGAADGNMWAFPETNGLQIWKTRVTGGGLSSPAVANGVAYFAQNGGSPSAIYALDATTGAYLWSSPISDPVDSSPAVSDGFLYVASNTKLYAFALNGGNNAVYKRHHTVPPAFSTLRPDISLKAMR